MSNDQANAFSSLGIDVTQEVIDKNRWYAFWDAPSQHSRLLPGTAAAAGEGRGASGRAAAQRPGRADHWPSRSPRCSRDRAAGPATTRRRIRPGFTGGRGFGLPRTKEEIRRGVSTFSASALRGQDRRQQPGGDVPGDEARDLRGQPPVHGLSRDEPDPDGCDRADQRAVGRLQVRRGTEGFVDRRRCRGSSGAIPAAGRSSTSSADRRPSVCRRSRGAIACSSPKARGGSIATFPPPHTFFFTREVDVNLGYVFYRNDGGGNIQHRRDDARGRSRHVPAIRAELRAVQRASRHVAEDVDVLLRQPGSRRSRRGRPRWRSRTTTSSSQFRATRRSSTTSICASSIGCGSAGSTRRSRI